MSGKIITMITYYLIAILLALSYIRAVLTDPGRVPQQDLRVSRNYILVTDNLKPQQRNSLKNIDSQEKNVQLIALNNRNDRRIN